MLAYGSIKIVDKNILSPVHNGTGGIQSVTNPRHGVRFHVRVCQSCVDIVRNRINRIPIPTSCNFFSESLSPENFDVKRAWPEAILE
jgi:hypothetical protein